jgi:hypothetical protein
MLRFSRSKYVSTVTRVTNVITRQRTCVPALARDGETTPTGFRNSNSLIAYLYWLEISPNTLHPTDAEI